MGETQGRPSCRRPTLGWGTQSRWDWGCCWEGTQGRPSFLRPTLGWGTQSRWDWGRWWVADKGGAALIRVLAGCGHSQDACASVPDAALRSQAGRPCPRVGLRAAGQPWAGGRNPVGIGGCWYGGQGRDALATAGGLRGRRAVMAGIFRTRRWGKKEPPGLRGSGAGGAESCEGGAGQASKALETTSACSSLWRA
jgi:hypothetical protein